MTTDNTQTSSSPASPSELYQVVSVLRDGRIIPYIPGPCTKIEAGVLALEYLTCQDIICLDGYRNGEYVLSTESLYASSPDLPPIQDAGVFARDPDLSRLFLFVFEHFNELCRIASIDAKIITQSEFMLEEKKNELRSLRNLLIEQLQLCIFDHSARAGTIYHQLKVRNQKPEALVEQIISEVAALVDRWY